MFLHSQEFTTECRFRAPLCVFKDTVPRENNQDYVQSLLPRLHTHSSLRARLSEKNQKTKTSTQPVYVSIPLLFLPVPLYPTDTFQCPEGERVA